MRLVNGIFDGLFGNDATKVRLGTAIRTGTLPHAFLIDGPRGSGKSTLAFEIAAALGCENRESATGPLPCRRCNTCRRIFEGTFTDVKVLDKPKDKATIGVESVKEFKEDMFLSAGESDVKIYIVKNAHLLTPQAQNALLTVMEEPPSGVFILLLSESADKILTTIKSRAQYVAMERFSRQALESYLLDKVPEARTRRTSDPEGFGALLIRSEGYIGRATELFDPKESERIKAERETVKKFIAALDVRAPYSALYAVITELPTVRAELLLSLEEIGRALADMIKSKSTDGFVTTEFFLDADEARRTAKSLSQKRLLAISGILLETHDAISKNAMTAAALASLAAKIKLI